MYKRNKITRTFWIRRGLAAIGDGLITLISLGWFDSGLSIRIAEKTIRYGMEKYERNKNR